MNAVDLPRAASEVEVFTQRRYRCPHCRRSWASKARATAHVAECPHSPATRACATCEHLDEPCCSTPNDSCGCHGLFWCLKGIPLEEFRQDLAALATAEALDRSQVDGRWTAIWDRCG